MATLCAVTTRRLCAWAEPTKRESTGVVLFHVTLAMTAMGVVVDKTSRLARGDKQPTVAARIG